MQTKKNQTKPPKTCTHPDTAKSNCLYSNMKKTIKTARDKQHIMYKRTIKDYAFPKRKTWRSEDSATSLEC